MVKYLDHELYIMSYNMTSIRACAVKERFPEPGVLQTGAIKQSSLQVAFAWNGKSVVLS